MGRRCLRLRFILLCSLVSLPPGNALSSSSQTQNFSLQKRAATIANSFQSSEFRPWLKNQHVQTIGGFLLKETCAYLPPGDFEAAQHIAAAIVDKVQRPKASTQFWHHRERIETPDGDWFHVDSRWVSRSDAPTVLIFHGLESNSESMNTQEMAQAFNDIGMHAICLNFRGCSGTPNNKLSGYHLGFTDDLHHYVARMAKQNTTSPVYLAGFSMGANVVLKALGEMGEQAALDYNIRGAAALCPPLDQNRNAEFLARPGINRVIYTGNLLKQLKKRTRKMWEILCDGDEETDMFDFRRTMAAQTVTEFDDAFHRGVNGFEDCWDYYRQTSCIHYLDKICVPTLLLGAKDDPFFDPAVWPIEKTREHGGLAPIKMVRTEHGGHLGYSFHQVETAEDERLRKNGISPPSWAQYELSRFLKHVESHY
ncbi:uncharacterized protein FisN_8Hh198 [Fistulifera solaris]|uniref:AB hydrolase-1 domain-containing protein n=1 Tax=Fistulifera solaris TaxID=1519565 RepID=A0A1Z5JY72_FISSO|nr:uncharacterized protein FisN_8Hh198 [Fistulifera solaris]|eukprot:GAX18977.1 uncharacterized protein FisN_8Hh198 [Fistulifera solaris]